MIRPALAFSSMIGALAVVGHFDAQTELVQDQHYCEMVSIQKHWIADHPMEIGREAAMNRPGWPEFRHDIDCTEFGFSFAPKFSIR